MSGQTMCEGCGFDAAEWTEQDLVRTRAALLAWWEQTVRGVDEAALAAVVRDGQRIAELTSDAGPVAESVHEATHALRSVGRTLHAVGAGLPRATGQVAQLNVSAGGLPKLPVDSVRVGRRGLEGDVQRTRKHHGRPWQALCLWSLEVIERLQAEGHPIAPGYAGENVTVAGIDWTTMRAGVRIRMGDVLAETTLWALPCFQNKPFFLGGDFGRMHHERELGVSRIYAWVLEPGEVCAGDPVVVEP